MKRQISVGETSYSGIFLFLSMLYLTIFLMSVLLINKRVTLFGVDASLASFIVPFGFTISDIVAEIYGYKASQRIIWNTLAIQGIFCILTPFLIKIGVSSSLQNQADFNYIFTPLPRIFLSGLIAIPTSIFLNVFLISKWKIILKGRYFWLRSIGASISGEILYTSICAFIIFLGVLKIDIILQLIFASCVIKFLFASICSYPANLFVNFLKKYENLDTYDQKVNFNPFTFKN